MTTTNKKAVAAKLTKADKQKSLAAAKVETPVLEKFVGVEDEDDEDFLHQRELSMAPKRKLRPITHEEAEAIKAGISNQPVVEGASDNGHILVDDLKGLQVSKNKPKIIKSTEAEVAAMNADLRAHNSTIDAMKIEAKAARKTIKADGDAGIDTPKPDSKPKVEAKYANADTALSIIQAKVADGKATRRAGNVLLQGPVTVVEMPSKGAVRKAYEFTIGQSAKGKDVRQSYWCDVVERYILIED